MWERAHMNVYAIGDFSQKLEWLDKPPVCHIQSGWIRFLLPQLIIIATVQSFLLLQRAHWMCAPTPWRATICLDVWSITRTAWKRGKNISSTEEWLQRHRAFHVKVPSIFNFQLLLLGHRSAGYAHCLPGPLPGFLCLTCSLLLWFGQNGKLANQLRNT